MCGPVKEWYTILERKAMTNLYEIVKDKHISMIEYSYENWILRKKIDNFECWIWKQFLRILWTVRRTNQLVVDERKTDYSP